jgi:hypothetical protein
VSRTCAGVIQFQDSVLTRNRDKLPPLASRELVVEANPGGLLLFSARNADRIRNNAKSVPEPHVTPAQVKLFAQFVERNLPTLSEYSYENLRQAV